MRQPDSWAVRRARPAFGGAGDRRHDRGQEDQRAGRVGDEGHAGARRRDDQAADDRAHDVQGEVGVDAQQAVDSVPSGVVHHGRREEAAAARPGHPEGRAEEEPGDEDGQGEVVGQGEYAQAGEGERAQYAVGDEERARRYAQPAQSDGQRQDGGQDERCRLDHAHRDRLRDVAVDGERLHRHGHEDHAGADVRQQVAQKEASHPAVAQDLAVGLVVLGRLGRQWLVSCSEAGRPVCARFTRFTPRTARHPVVLRATVEAVAHAWTLTGATIRPNNPSDTLMPRSRHRDQHLAALNPLRSAHPITSAGPALRPFKPFSSLVQIDVSALSHTGLLRENNEDQFCVTRMSRVHETLLTSLPAGDVPERAEEVNYVMIVADGMGGHAAGELASRLAISALVGLALELPYWIIKLDSEEASKELERRARALVQEVGEIVFKRGHEDASLRGMGSTLTAARSLGRDLLVFHVGDSRAYLLRAGGLHRLTRDHTYAQMLVDCGKLGSSERRGVRVRSCADERARRIDRAR